MDRQASEPGRPAGQAPRPGAAEPAPAEPRKPPDPPRALTEKVRRQSWLDRRVRACWLLAGASLAVIVPFVVIQLVQGYRDQRLFRHGLRVTATIESMGEDEKRPSYMVSPEERLPVVLRFTMPWGQEHRVRGVLEGQESFIHPDEQIPIYVDPADADHWTDRVKPISLLRELVAAYALLPVVAVCAAAALIARARLLNAWVHGETHEGLVVDVTQTAVAPRSRQVRCTLRWGRDKTVVSLIVPVRVARYQQGDTIWLVMPRDQPHRALAAAVYL